MNLVVSPDFIRIRTALARLAQIGKFLADCRAATSRSHHHQRRGIMSVTYSLFYLAERYDVLASQCVTEVQEPLAPAGRGGREQEPTDFSVWRPT
jgi:hypothetical protein